MKHHRILTCKLTSFDGTTLTGVIKNGITLTATVLSKTIYHVTNLNQYIPTDPVLPLIASYNKAVRSGKRNIILNAVTQLANAGANVQIRLEPYSTIVTSLRPTSSIL
ncbi:TPA: hypothetical protein QC116_003313 [Bacillus thuringiensis]|uniref:Uncharacterized protein n=1 Tax=Bacillus cereus TaxID=1396 RepID=A0A2B9PBT1_BACCE|nr:MULTISPECIES: hypothetical protein [Bacillus cereus group]HDR8183881.1 hypothetical protein [Bacillus thuringiensis]MED0989726.1 hypothetical protein [Bacillus nitratireducens]OJD49959.1 hypothetical protein BAU23_12410 [Bacillus nitratireducens]PFJ79035.1 hypothetical protein COI95_14005 [Bacillus cereus]PGO20103.1 hypothetical protein CN984_29945 [Bacillus cereus]